MLAISGSLVKDARRTDLGFTGVSRVVTEADQHDSRDVDHLAVEFQHSSRGLHLRLQSMRRRTKHHQTSGQFEEEILTSKDGGDVHGDLERIERKTGQFENEMQL